MSSRFRVTCCSLDDYGSPQTIYIDANPVKRDVLSFGYNVVELDDFCSLRYSDVDVDSFDLFCNVFKALCKRVLERRIIRRLWVKKNIYSMINALTCSQQFLKT